MRNCLTLLRKELQTLFLSPIAYVVLAAFFLVTGVFFFLITTSILDRLMEEMFRSQQFGQETPGLDVSAIIMRQYLGVLTTMILFVAPMLTMGTLAEEKRRGTIELLFTAPITQTQLIMGKFGGLLVFFLVMLSPSLLHLGSIYYFSSPRPLLGPILVGYVGLLLIGSALLSIGLCISSLTENQLVSAVLTWGVFLALWVVDAASLPGSGFMGDLLTYLSLPAHFDDFTRGILDTSHIVFYLSVTVLALFLTSVSLDSLKWRQ